MLNQRAIEVELLEPVITSESVATAADPSALPYIPGAMLWGVAVSRAYQSGGTAAEILNRFHGGDLLFDDALPVDVSGVGLPAPKSLHRPKAGSAGWEDWSDGTRKAGYRQTKSGSLGPGLTEVKVHFRTTLRTAIDPTTGLAADGQFFGLSALAEGQRFVARIAGLDAQMVDEVIRSLAGVQRLGRSRNAEFGRVRIAEVSPPGLPQQASGEGVRLWCLSDLAAHDDRFQPTERPDDAFFGAPIDWSRSFVRHRRYAPFNAHWQTRTPERLVISRGSVIVLKSPIAAGLHRFGFHVEQGLGLVMASAETPLDLLIGWETEAALEGSVHEPATRPNDGESQLPEFATWLERRAATRHEASAVRVGATGAWDKWYSHYQDAARLAGERVGPTATQWGRFASVPDTQVRSLIDDLMTVGDRRESRAWRAPFGPGETQTFVAALREVLGDDKAGPERVRRLAQAVRTGLVRKGWFNA